MRKSTKTKRKAKKRPVPRAGLDRPFNNGQWTLARFRGFVISALRRAAWPPKHQAIARAFVGDGVNPATGKKCKLHKCEQCSYIGPKSHFHADHKKEVVPIEKDWSEEYTFLGYDWNDVVRRLYCEADGFDILCIKCHAEVTDREREMRKKLVN
jgi:hypothetical protein